MSSRPSSSMSGAPPRSPSGTPSSAGWKTSNTFPGRRSRRSTRMSATPSRMAVCASCPQACMTPTLRPRNSPVAVGPERHIGLFSYRQGIDVGAEQNRRARKLAGNDGHDAGMRNAGADLETQRAQVLCNFRGCADFAVGELRIAVKIPAPFDDPRFDCCCRGIEFSRGNFSQRSRTLDCKQRGQNQRCLHRVLPRVARVYSSRGTGSPAADRLSRPGAVGYHPRRPGAGRQPPRSGQRGPVVVLRNRMVDQKAPSRGFFVFGRFDGNGPRAHFLFLGRVTAG